MQRLARLSLCVEQQQAMALFAQFAQIKSLLAKQLPPSTVNLFAEPVLKAGQIVEWYTSLQGQPYPMAENKLCADMAQKIQQKITSIQQFLKHLKAENALPVAQLTVLEQAVAGLSYSERQIYLVNNEPVIVGWGLGSVPKPTASVVVPTVATAPMSLLAKHRCCWLALSLGLLGLLVGLVWGLWLKPIPGIKSIEQSAVTEQPKALELKHEPVLEAKVEEPKPEPEKNEELKVEDLQTQTAVPSSQPKVCRQKIEPTKHPQMVIVIDNSLSMLFSLKEKNGVLEEWWDNASYDGRDLRTMDGFDYYTREPRRTTVATKSAVKIVDKIDKDMDIALLSIDYCPSATNLGFFQPNQRKSLKTQIQSIVPQPLVNENSGTALYAGLQQAAAMVDGKNQDAFILLLSDGEDTCKPKRDICALAQNLAKSQPKLKVNIVDIGGTQAANCVAKATGGQVFTANSKAQIVAMVNKAVQPIVEKEECK